MATRTEEKIREIAHKLWIEAGQPEGDALAHWFQAEELASAKPKRKAVAKTVAKTATKPATAKVEAPKVRARKA